MNGEFRIGLKGNEYDVVVVISSEPVTEDSLEQIQIWFGDEPDHFYPRQPKTGLHHAILEVVYDRYGISHVLEDI